MLVVRPSEPFLTEDVAAAAEEMVQVILFKKAIFFRSDAKGINVCVPLYAAACTFFTPVFSAVYNQERLISVSVHLRVSRISAT